MNLSSGIEIILLVNSLNTYLPTKTWLFKIVF